MIMRTLSAVVAVALGAVAAPPAVQAARPIIGITCGGGFFVRHRQDVYWVNEADKTRTEVHDGTGDLLAMAECGSGVVSVLSGATEADPLRVLYSPDCQNLSQTNGATTQLYSADGGLKAFAVTDAGIAVTLSSGQQFTSQICTRP